MQKNAQITLIIRKMTYQNWVSMHLIKWITRRECFYQNHFFRIKFCLCLPFIQRGIPGRPGVRGSIVSTNWHINNWTNLQNKIFSFSFFFTLRLRGDDFWTAPKYIKPTSSSEVFCILILRNESLIKEDHTLTDQISYVVGSG